METLTMYHNPQCSQSRKALEILRAKGFDPLIIDYLKTPLTIEQLMTLRANFALEDFVRTKEAVFQQLGLSLDNEAQLLQAMLKEPRLMQRPIVTYKGKSILGRPPENILKCFDEE
ncbi:MAG: arsenate reductase family protein [Legionellaceae bacterium]|nr:arsenate reductase family protein [Legionellaceae bacterium]